MHVTVVYPSVGHTAYKIAAETFCELARDVAAATFETVADTAFRASPDNLTVLIGSDAVNSVTAHLYLTQKVDSFGIRYGTDDYCIRTVEAEGITYLILAGGRGRSTMYAVYRYFEQYMGCRWFWDGDRLKTGELVTSGVDLTESPRFDYRGIRYFAHRSLHRFQAEHWSLADWQREIDWMLKKRLNLFMLRIGMDDLFQKAFPDIVSYPNRDEPLPEAGEGYNDRTLFWSLQYRSELRKQLLQYAFERDLMHPEDCGTMTHWYSRTPQEFLDAKNPTMLPQATKSYSEPTGLVWDVRENENLQNYFRLTDTHVNEYGNGEMFHTIGLGERNYSKDPEENRRMKLYVYRRIASYIKEKYPNAPLLIASWDLWMRFTPEEVRELVRELDPRQSIIFDYTSDTSKVNNFTQWGLTESFPWIFGIFSAYEPESEIRGYYELTNERIKAAKADSACKGVVLWPELSHGDPLISEYLSVNAWETNTPSIPEFLNQFCADRYSEKTARVMTDLWQDVMPIISLVSWSMENSAAQSGNPIFTYALKRAAFDPSQLGDYRFKLGDRPKYTQLAAELLGRLSRIEPDDEQVKRDLYDIARTIIGRYLDATILKAQIAYVEHASGVEALMDSANVLMRLMTELLSSHTDYSLYDSLQQLRSVTETNPHFERTLKNNAECMYCRSYIYENAAYLYSPELRCVFDEVKKAMVHNKGIDCEAIQNEFARIKENYFDTPLETMHHNKPHVSFATVCEQAKAVLEQLNL